jgi:hypothetical protein
MTTGKIGLVVTDLDGTLWDHRCRIHPRTLEALSRLESAGIPVLAATARRPYSVTRHLGSNGVNLPAVLFDGCLGRDFRSGSTFHKRSFDTETATWVLGELRAVGIEPCMNVDDPDKDAVAGHNTTTVAAHLREIEAVLRRADLDTVMANEPVLSFIACGGVQEEFELVARSLGDRATVSVSRDLTFGGFTLSVRPERVNKWEGVLSYCASRGLDPDRVLAVGDGENDVELLRGAAVACAVENSCDAVLRITDLRVPTPDVGGWAEILDLV